MELPLIFITYDGIHNSVFEGQVLQPLINQRYKNYDKKICLISFESEYPLAFEPIKKRCMQHDIQLIICKKNRFLWKKSLNTPIQQLKQILAQYATYELIARGPLAGYIALQAYNQKHCTHLIIQARGLLAEEYTYTHRNITNMILNYIHTTRAKQFQQIEQLVYGTTLPHVIIESVSPALKTYLIEHFGTQEKKILIAQHDIPQPIITAQKTLWRSARRTQLNIPTDAHVYCYNGSAKPWQCPDEALTFFKKQHEKNKNSFLLILTDEVQTFEQLAQKHTLDTKSYAIKKVPYSEIYQYLSACDTGLIFRDENILNWVSRPTKILEYQAVGLQIKHNNTIAYISDK